MPSWSPPESTKLADVVFVYISSFLFCWTALVPNKSICVPAKRHMWCKGIQPSLVTLGRGDEQEDLREADGVGGTNRFFFYPPDATFVFPTEAREL